PTHYHPEAIIKSVKEELRKIPEKGIGYGLLRYLHPDTKTQDLYDKKSWDIVFNYLGQFDTTIQKEAVFTAAKENKGESISPDYPFNHKFEINSSITQGEFSLSWSYSKNDYAPSTI